MTTRHQHDMKPIGRGTARGYKCSSCAFSCTAAALGLVNARKGQHVVVKASDLQARKLWNGAA